MKRVFRKALFWCLFTVIFLFLTSPTTTARGSKLTLFMTLIVPDTVSPVDSTKKIVAFADSISPSKKKVKKELKTLQDSTQERELASELLIDSVAREAVLVDSLVAQGDSLKVKVDSVTFMGDSIPLKGDTSVLAADSLKTEKDAPADTTASEEGIAGFDAPIQFESTDSMIVFPRANMARLYGEAHVKYTTQELSGDYIRMQMDSSTVYSTYRERPDSLADQINYPKFVDGEETYEAKSMTYNFKSKKGFTTDIVTQQGEGYITADKTKKTADESMFMEGIKYSTCDNHENPHFYIAATKAKVRPKKNLVSGPAYLVIADVPLPIALPFGFFPFTDTYSSGIIPPTPGEEYERGFYLRNGGYYWAINDYADFQITGDIYTKGSWGLNAQSAYAKRYRFSGSFDASYIVTVRGDKVAGDYSKATDFRIAWNHRQDPKANPYRTFSANVNFSTSSYNHNNLEGLYNQAVLGQNTKSSNVSFTQRFPNNPLSISGSFDITQRSQDSTVAITAPNLSISLSRIYPFKRKKAVGKERWYEKIQLSYSGQLRNFIQTKEDKVFKSNLIKDWKHGMDHSIPISASFDLFNYIKISPSIQYKERWYTSKINKTYDEKARQFMPADTTYGFYRVYDYSTSLSASTTIYGFWKPLPFLGDKLNMVRHRLEPSISINYKPDFGAPSYGYWETVYVEDSDGNVREMTYSPYEGQIFGVPGRGMFGGLSFSLNQNLEAKIKDREDSTAFKKISIIDNLSTSMSYNMAAKEFKWSDLSASLSLRLPGNINIRLNGQFDTYLYDYKESEDGTITPYKVDKMRIANGKGLGRLRSTGTSFSYNLNPETFKKLKGLFSRKGKKDGKEDDSGPGSSQSSSASETPPPGSGLDASMRGGGGKSLMGGKDISLGTYDSDGYLENEINWNIGFSYSMNLGYNMQEFDTKKKEYKYQLRHDLSFNGQFNPTRNWNFNFSANYNFEQKKITNMTCNLTRDLHCWSMTASFIPIGPFKSYNFSIQVKSTLLQDLKYRQSNNPRRGRSDSWY